MKSKTSFFNGTLFWNTVKRFWPIFAAYIAIWLIAMPMSLNSTLSWAQESRGYVSPMAAAQSVMGSLRFMAPFMSALFAMLFAMAGFSYLYNSKSTSMMGSLPMKREGVLFSVASPGLFGMLISNVVVFGLTAAVEASYSALNMGYLLQWLGVTCLCCLFFYGFACLCGSFTGNLFVLPAVFIILNFTVVVVEYCARTILTGVYYGISASSNVTLSELSPLHKLAINNSVFCYYNEAGNLTNIEYTEWTLLIIYGVVGIAFLVGAALLVKHRRMEAAGDVVAVNPLKPVFKYCMTLGCALVLGIIINYVIFYNYDGQVRNGFAILAVCMIVGAFIGYFAAEMLIRRTLKVFRGRVWIGLAVSCFVIIAFMLSCSFDVFGFERRVPEAEEVLSVNLYGNFDMVSVSEPENIEAVTQLHRSIIEHKEEYLNYGNEKPDYSDPDSSVLTGKNEYVTCFSDVEIKIDYYLKNGSVVTRSYKLYSGCENNDIEMLSDIINSHEAVEDRKRLSIPVTANAISYGYISYYDADTGDYTDYTPTAEEMVDLYKNCILPDIDDGYLGNIWLNDKVKVNGKTYGEALTSCTVSFDLSQRVGAGSYKNDSFCTYVTLDAERTLTWLREHGIEPLQVGEEYVEKAFGTVDSDVNAATAEVVTEG